MGTTTYFDREVTDAISQERVDIDIGTTGMGGNGPQVYLRVGKGEVLFSHDDAERFCKAVADIARYSGYVTT